MESNVARYRLYTQSISTQRKNSVAETVRHMLALQSQDYEAGKHAVGLRARVTYKEVVSAINNAQIVRTWPMRGTIHIVAASDIRWMLELMGTKPLAGAARRMDFLGIDTSYIDKCRKATLKYLSGTVMTRNEYYEMLKKNNIVCESQIGYHVIWRMCQEGVMCFAKEKSGQPTLALLDEWIKPTRPLARDESLRELVTRYFTGHGPATIADLMFWSGLGKRDIQKGIEAAEKKIVSQDYSGEIYYSTQDVPKTLPSVSTYLLDAFDEYLLGYKIRDLVLEKKYVHHVATKNGIFRPTIILDGHVAGTWKKEKRKSSAVVSLRLFHKLSDAQKKKIEKACIVNTKYFDHEIEYEFGEV